MESVQNPENRSKKNRKIRVLVLFIPGQLQEEFSGYPIVKRDGCEYIACKTYGEFIIYVHKGNCSNPIHMYNIEKPIPILRDNNAIREKALSKLTKEEKEVLGIKE